MTVRISPDIEAISAFLDALPQNILAEAPPTHFPVALPLSFPTPLHHLNLICILHIVEATFLHPRHALYLASAGVTAHDAVLRGVMGAFLASDESWTADNLLSAAAWTSGKMDEAKVADLFMIETMKEQNHETMRGVKVGGRWAPGVSVAGDLVGLFKRMGEAISARGGRCVGDAAKRALKASKEGVEGIKGEKAHEFARIFCDKAVAFDSSLQDPYPAPTGKVIPAAPLKLLQDLSRLPNLAELEITGVPKAHDLENVSPLPLSISLITYAGLVDTSSIPSEHSTSVQALSTTPSAAVNDITSLMQSGGGGGGGGIQQRTIETAALPLDVLTALQTASVEVCREIWGTARFSSDRDPGAEWKRELSLLDVYKIGVVLEGYRWAGRMGKELVQQV